MPAVAHGYFEALHQNLEEQYAQCDCESCKNKRISLAKKGKENTPFNDVLKSFEKAFKKLFEKKSYRPEDLLKIPEYKEVIQATSQVFSSAIPHEVPQQMKAYLEKDAFVFSGLKTHAQLTEARSLLKDEKGSIRPYYQFEREVLKLNEKYNKNYLEAEYQFAVSSSQSAASWASLQEGTERYSLEYRTAGDEKVRQSHANLNGICLPKNDPFWQEFYPPNGWRCRCIAVEVLAKEKTPSDSKKAILEGEKATTQISKTGKNKLAMFRFNAGAEQKMFPPNNSYTKVVGADVVKKELEQALKKKKDTTEEDEKKVFDLFQTDEKDVKKQEYYKKSIKINKDIRPAESLGMYEYTGNFYKDINPYLRSGRIPPDADFDTSIRVINSGLDKLKTYKGVVYRGADLSSEVIDEYKKALKTGKPFVEKHYLSTSKDREKAFTKNTKYQITSKTGAEIEEISQFGSEKEILFKEGTKFKILEVYVDSDGYNRIVMEEV